MFGNRLFWACLAVYSGVVWVLWRVLVERG
jgi:hypothetical protein